MNIRQIVIALCSTMLMDGTALTVPKVPSSAPVLSNAEEPSFAPSIGFAHKLKSTYFLDQHADGRSLTVNGYTSVLTFKNLSCGTGTQGCEIGFDGMIQVLCRNTDGSSSHYYEIGLYAISVVDGVYGAVAPLQNPLIEFISSGNPNYFTVGTFSYLNYQGVTNGTTNNGALQIEMLQFGGTDSPDCILGDWTVSIPFYSP